MGNWFRYNNYQVNGTFNNNLQLNKLIRESAQIFGEQTVEKVSENVYQRINSSEYLSDPVEYLRKWDTERGSSEELRIPEDISREIIAKYHHSN